MHSERQGKCTRCKVRYTWEFHQGGTDWPVKYTHCPVCGAKLSLTSHLSKLPEVRLVYGLKHQENGRPLWTLIPLGTQS